MKKNSLKMLVIAALFCALGVVLPTAFHFVPNAGKVFLPMHIPVLLCGFICGPFFGLACGIISPLISSLATAMPPAAMLPQMICELALYGFASGIIFNKIKIKTYIVRIYVSLISAMLVGRIVYGILNALVFSAGKYSFEMWTAAAFVTALPGIIIQLAVIPALLYILKKAKLIS